MRAHRRAPLTPREITILIGAVLVGVALLGGLIVVNARWSAVLPGGGGFFAIWASAREFLFHNGDPYGPVAAVRAQALVHGGATASTANPYRLDLPFFLLPLYFPFGLIADPNLARAVWATLSQMALVAAAFIGMRLVDWRPPPAWLLALPLAALLSYPAVSALVDGTPSPMLLLLYMGILRALQTEKDELAGFLAVLALFKWEVGLPLFIILAARVLQERRWRVLAGFGMAFTILIIVAFIIYPGWLMPFLVGTVAMLRSGFGVSTRSAFLMLVPDAVPNAVLALTAFSLGLLVVEMLAARTSGPQHFAWFACLALAATPLLGFRSEIANLITLLPGLTLIAAGGSHRRPYGLLISCFLFALLAGAPWLLVSANAAVSLARAEALIFVLLPLICLFGMYWTRWWYLRPPRTWMDEIRASN